MSYFLGGPPSTDVRRGRRTVKVNLLVLRRMVFCRRLVMGWRQGRDPQPLPSRSRRGTRCRAVSVRGTRLVLHSYLGALGALCAFRLGGETAVAAPSLHNMEGELFSARWLTEFSAGNNECTLARESYVWRIHGFGSNVNNMLNAWVWALSVQRWEDIALVLDPSLMGQVDCAESSSGQVSTGWNCLFSPMPHLCEFNSTEEWVDHMKSRGVSEDEVAESQSLTQKFVRGSPDMIIESLEGTAADHFKALSVMADYLWSHLAPWVKSDVMKITHAAAAAALHDVPFIGIHVRRGDKVRNHEAQFYGVEQYLAAGAEFMLHSKDGHAWHGSIKGIWVASDDPNVIDEVRQIYHRYFPYVEPELIVWVSDGVEGALETKGVATHTSEQRYPSYVYMFTDLEQLAKAEVFVGTFSSNVGRLVALLREAAGKSRKSSISIDRDWVPGRV